MRNDVERGPAAHGLKHMEVVWLFTDDGVEGAGASVPG